MWNQAIATSDRNCFVEKLTLRTKFHTGKNNFGELSWWNKYMLFAGWEVRIVKTCDRELENAAQGRRPKATFSSFSLYGPTLGRQMTCWFFFCSKLVLQITNGFASVCLSLVHPLCDKHNTSQISISISTGKKEHVLFSCAYAYAYFTCVMLIAQAWTRLYATLSLNRLAPRLLTIC